MSKEDYIQTITVNGIKVDIGVDDYGQCYYYEYTNADGEKVEMSCGTYNTNYLECIYGDLDPVYHALSKKDLFGEDMTLEEIEEYKTYNEVFEQTYKEVMKKA